MDIPATTADNTPARDARALTIGSLFAGIGGLELGLERGIGNGARTVWQVEQSEYCRAVLAKHWPDATRYEDVRCVGRSNLSPVDIICGGFPCQDISVAGKRAGIAGERSGLWSEYSRIVGELRPRYVVVENVAALLTRGFGRVLGDLATLGYDAEWECIPAAAVGAPHIRDRVFVLAYRSAAVVARAGSEWRLLADSTRDGSHGSEHDAHRSAKRDVISDAQRSSEAVADPARSGRRQEPAHRERSSEADRAEGACRRGPLLGSTHVSDPEARWHGGRDERMPEGGSAGRCGADHGGRTPLDALGTWWAVEPDVGRVADGIRSRVDRLRALGNAVVPACAEVVGWMITEREAERCEAA